MSRWKRSSSSSSRSCRSRPNRARVAAPTSWYQAMSSASLQGKAEDAVDGAGRAVPVGHQRGELAPALGRELVVPGAAVVLARAPRGADPPAAHHPLERRVERPLVDVEDVAG